MTIMSGDNNDGVSTKHVTNISRSTTTASYVVTSSLCLHNNNKTMSGLRCFSTVLIIVISMMASMATTTLAYIAAPLMLPTRMYMLHKTTKTANTYGGSNELGFTGRRRTSSFDIIRTSSSGINRELSSSSTALPMISSPFGSRILSSSRSTPPPVAICYSSKKSSFDEGDMDSDEEEWRMLISAFQMYKAAYGDLKVPSRFVVPSMPPWPEPTWALKLGHRVAAIRSTGKYVQTNETRRKVLDDLGFLWRLRGGVRDKKMEGVTFEQIYEALSTYRTEIQSGGGTLQIPANFVVPDCDPWPMSTRGMPLGKKIPTVRGKAYLKANPGATERLRSIGFEFDGKVAANDQRYNTVFSALMNYKRIYGDLLVPQPFVVPEEGSPDWPEENSWGLRLGARVNAIRSQGTFIKSNPARKDQLDELGFVWEPPISDTKKRGRKKKVENEVLMGLAPPGILSSTDNPEDSPINIDPSNTNIPTREDTTSLNPPPAAPMRTAFDPLMGGGGDSVLNFPSELPKWNMLRDDLPPMEPQQQEPDWKPPPNFEETNIAAQQRALDIGIITSISDNDSVVKGSIQMQHPWFNDDFGGEFVFEDVVEALTLYKQIHGNFEGLDEDEFLVPEPLSTDFFGDDNGAFLSDVSDDDMFADADSALGGGTATGDDLIAQEIERMEMEMQAGGATMMAMEPTEEDLLLAQQQLEEDFAQSASSAATSDTTTNTNNNQQQWPEHLAGMQLGTIVRRIREGDLEVKHLPKRKAQLDAIAFEWGDSKKFLDVPFDKSMCAMFAYYMIRGDLFVYEDFVMPDEDPWPKALAGFELGKAVFRLRAKQNFLEAYYPQKKYMLNMLEFVWFPLDALPLDPDAPPLSWEHEHVKHIGHPLARINAPPYSAVEHVHSVDHPDAQDRYEFSYELVRDYYENELGVRDIGGFLRERGFHELAAEHEAEYGKATPVSELEYEVEGAGYVEEEAFYEEEEYDDELNDEALDEENFNFDEEDEEVFEEEEEEEEPEGEGEGEEEEEEVFQEEEVL